MSDITLEATARTDTGKGASRRLRRLENLVPAIIYGGSKKPVNISLAHNKLIKALENEAIFSSVFTLNVDGKNENVILKDFQRHPYKSQIMHMDLQRVSLKDVLTKIVPLHFINDESSKAIKAGGVLSKIENQVEIRCKAKDLPEFIEVDLADLAVGKTIHLSELNLPKGVELTADTSDSSHDHPVVSINKPKRGGLIDEEGEASDEASSEDSAE